MGEILCRLLLSPLFYFSYSTEDKHTCIQYKCQPKCLETWNLGSLALERTSSNVMGFPQLSATNVLELSGSSSIGSGKHLVVVLFG